MSKFVIKSYDDYHEIEDEGGLELGCFTAIGFNYRRYFGLFYKGKKPTIDKVMKVLALYVDYGCVLSHTRRDISNSREEVEWEVRKTLQSVKSN